MSNLKLLELGDNRICQLSGLDQLHSLRELWLGRNRVASISGLARYPAGFNSSPCNVPSCMHVSDFYQRLGLVISNAHKWRLQQRETILTKLCNLLFATP